MPRAISSERVAEDLLEIWLHFAEQSESSADRVLDRIDDVVRMLAENPHAGVARPELAARLRSFPVDDHTTFYRVIPGGVELVRILHGARDIPTLIP